MNPLVSVLLLVGGLRAGRKAPVSVPFAVRRAPGPADAAVAAGLVGLAALAGLVAVLLGSAAFLVAVLLLG